MGAELETRIWVHFISYRSCFRKDLQGSRGKSQEEYGLIPMRLEHKSPPTADPPWDKEAGLLHPHVSLSVATPGGNPRKGVFSLRLLWVRQLPSAKDSLQRRSSCGLFRNTCSDWGMRVPAEKGDLLRGQQLPGVKSCWLFYYNCKDHWWANIMHFSKSLLFANQIPNLKLHYKLLSALIIF